MRTLVHGGCDQTLISQPHVFLRSPPLYYLGTNHIDIMWHDRIAKQDMTSLARQWHSKHVMTSPNKEPKNCLKLCFLCLLTRGYKKRTSEEECHKWDNCISVTINTNKHEVTCVSYTLWIDGLLLFRATSVSEVCGSLQIECFMHFLYIIKC
jgi:hypothetical protein